MLDGAPGDAFFTRLSRELHDRFRIGHPTVQIEVGEEDTDLSALLISALWSRGTLFQGRRVPYIACHPRSCHVSRAGDQA